MIERLLRRIGESVDGTLLSIALALLALGLATLFSASNENAARFSSQLVNIGIALSLMWIMAQIPPQTLFQPTHKMGLVRRRHTLRKSDDHPHVVAVFVLLNAQHAHVIGIKSLGLQEGSQDITRLLQTLGRRKALPCHCWRRVVEICAVFALYLRAIGVVGLPRKTSWQCERRPGVSGEQHTPDGRRTIFVHE